MYSSLIVFLMECPQEKPVIQYCIHVNVVLAIAVMLQPVLYVD